MAITARRHRAAHLLVPDGNAAEAGLIGELPNGGARTLQQVVGALVGSDAWPEDCSVGLTSEAADESGQPDLRDVRGKAVGHRGLEVAAAGGHHMILMGTAWVRQNHAGPAPGRAPAATDTGRTLLGSHPHPPGLGSAAPGRQAAAAALGSAHPTTASRPRRCWGAGLCRGRVKCLWRMATCCFSTSWRSFAARCSISCSSRWKKTPDCHQLR